MSEIRVDAIVKQMLGPQLLEWLADPDVLEVLVRPDWVSTDRLSTGLQSEPGTRATIKLKELMRVLAPLCGIEASVKTPIIDLDLPGMEVRFAGVYIGYDGDESIASFRKGTEKTYTLAELEEQKVVNPPQVEIFRHWIATPNTGLLIAGKPGSGKTSLMRTLVQEAIVARGAHDHFIVVEDTREIRVVGPHVTYLTSTPWLPYMMCIRVSLRQRPTRLIVGEVRGGESLDAVKGANVGAGLLMSIHAHKADQAVRVLLARMKEGSTSGFVDPQLVVDGIPVIATCSRYGNRFRVDTISRLEGINGDDPILTTVA